MFIQKVLKMKHSLDFFQNQAEELSQQELVDKMHKQK